MSLHDERAYDGVGGVEMDKSATGSIRHVRGPHGASHPAWGFRREAVIWTGDAPICANMFPLAAEMCKWLKQKSQGLTACTEEMKGKAGSCTNPYTYHATAIGAALGAVINAAYAFSELAAPMDPLGAEVQRIRLQNELVLYVARFCEATIKQMLFCTQIPRRLYKRASLGQLLSIECDECRKAGKERHDLSMLGALAHQYFLCHTLDSCVLTHLQLVGRRRNLEAAHSDSQTLNVRGAAESQLHLARTLKDVGNEFGHMVDHIGQIEQQMITEISLHIAHWPNLPSIDGLMSIPARPRV